MQRKMRLRDNDKKDAPGLILGDDRSPGPGIGFLLLTETELAARFDQNGKRLQGSLQPFNGIVRFLDKPPEFCCPGWINRQHPSVSHKTATGGFSAHDGKPVWKVFVVCDAEVAAIHHKIGVRLFLPGIQRLGPVSISDIQAEAFLIDAPDMDRRDRLALVVVNWDHALLEPGSQGGPARIGDWFHGSGEAGNRRGCESRDRSCGWGWGWCECCYAGRGRRIIRHRFEVIRNTAASAYQNE